MDEMIERKLWFREREESTSLTQADLIAVEGAVVVLGEAGMGKTTLLQWVASQPGHAFCTARQLINRSRPETLLGNATTLIIDALDEVATKQDGDAVDLVLRKLGELDYPRFVLSCRVADWQSAVSVASIAEQYDLPPRELHLEPLSDADALDFLISKLGEGRGYEVRDHFNQYGLKGFLGNPQTLEMIERGARRGALPKTSSELFDRAIDVIWKEHRDEKAAQQFQKDVTLDAAGAAFAALLLTGSEAISRTANANLAEGELALADVEAFDSGNVGAVLGTRLFRAPSPDRFSYWHRRIGEYLGARWLAAQADTRGKRRRLIAMLTSEGLVRASFRGLFAWLALDPALSTQVVMIDPMAVIEYGDADVLDADGARALLTALNRLALENPRFRGFGPYRAKALVQLALVPELRVAISDLAVPSGLRLLILQQVEGTQAASLLKPELRTVLLNHEYTFNERATAGNALARLKDSANWPTVLEALRCQADLHATQVAIQILTTIGVNFFDDRLICELLLGHVGITASSLRRTRRVPAVGVFMALRLNFPVERIEAMLDLIISYLVELTGKDRAIPDNIVELIVDWMTLFVHTGNVNALKLLHWMRVIRPGNPRNRRAWGALSKALKANAPMRRGVQKIALLDEVDRHSVRAAISQLGHLSPALWPDEGDVIVLLASLNSGDRTDLRWRDVLLLSRHDGEQGTTVRDAAKPFASHRQDLLAWIERLAFPRPSKHKRRKARAELKQRGRKALHWADVRRTFSRQVGSMLTGDPQWLIGPAECYLGLFHDSDKQQAAPQRLAEWLGAELAASAMQGFECHLTKSPPGESSARQIAQSLAKGQFWQAGRIIVAALAERQRVGRGFQDLPAERLMAGWLELRHLYDDVSAGKELRDMLEVELKRRMKWRSTQVLLLETQLRLRRTFVEGLYELMNGRGEEPLATDLALGWLLRWNDIPFEPERDLVRRIVHSARRSELAAIATSRLATNNLDSERRRNWLAVQIIIDFDQAIIFGNTQPIPKDMLWDLRDYLARARSNGSRSSGGMGVRQWAWIVENFRGLWPYTAQPTASQGEMNPWEAAEFLCWAISRIGEHTSDEAIDAMSALRDTHDGYDTVILDVASEQRRRRVDVLSDPAELRAVTDVLSEGPPTNAADLQAVVLEALEVAQARLKGDPLDWYKGFYAENGVHKDEEACRDELMKLLDGKIPAVEMRPESHLADEKRVDIECSAGPGIMVPVEIKGQWHKALWTAADDQLDKLYSSDWRADRRGIYLVLWFGGAVTLTTDPSGKSRPETCEELRERLASCSNVCSSGLVRVVVLDLTRP